uniref:FIGNL1 interacting regulator of recombination and mitosis n=1 Tax=Oryzias sinensis TaxID=183150 RepID=A0A8C7YM84_9TELE
MTLTAGKNTYVSVANAVFMKTVFTLRCVLPKFLIICLKCVLGILRIITHVFLPHIGLSGVEEDCFSKILPKAVTMFHRLMKEITDQVGGLSSQNTELRDFLRTVLQAMAQIIDALSTCVHHVSSLEETPDLRLIRSLPMCILTVLKETFQHCKDSEVVYCGRLSLVADLLQGLFKEAYALHKGLLEVLDKISLDSQASDEEVSDIVTVIHSLLDICSVISNLDIALHANTWKFLIKQSLKHRPLVEEHLRHGDLSSSLCDNLLTSFHNCVELAEQIQHAGLQDSTQSTEYKLFQKTAKMCRFFANTLIHYIKEFKYFLTKYCSRFHQLYLQIITKFPPSLCAPALPAALSGELSAAAAVPMDAFLLQLLPLGQFADVVLQVDLQLNPDHELPHCLLLASIVGQLTSQPEEVLQLWYAGSQFPEETPRLPLYKAIFDSFRRCDVERKVPVLLPGVMLKGQAQARVSLHRHICVQLCASIAALPPKHFPMLERCLIDAVLQADTQTALLATDAWCFTARYGSAELCFHHVLLVAQLVKTCPTECYRMSHLGILLKRLVFLMTPKHQEQLVEHFPPSELENRAVWDNILFGALSQDTRLRVEADMISLAQNALTDWRNGGYKMVQVDQVNVALSSLLSVVRGQPSPTAQPAVEMITEVWLRMSPAQVRSCPVLQDTLQLLLPVTAALVKNAEPHILCQALSCLDAVVSGTCPDHLLLAALDFLSSMGKVFVPPESQSPVLPKLSGLFGVLLADKSWLVQQHALEAFSFFAENTNHEEVISQSLCVEETKTRVVRYLSKTLSPQENAELRLQRLREESPVLQKFLQKLESAETACSPPAAESEAAVASEPCPKRPRQESSAEEEYSRYLQTAESALTALQALLQGKGAADPPPPPWLEPRLQELQVLMTRITSSTSKTS